MSAQNANAEEAYIALSLRQHTIFGVCEGIGEDFGFNPIFLRVPLAAAVLWSPLIAIGTYFALGALVLVSRLVFPRPTAIAAQSVNAIESDNDQLGRDSMPIAA
ncbi:MAG TPA: PspC domain-containing protein [Sphingomicrobium sp.]|nr:PspC domain-containing protein [Sphingomicrobium sp.]